MGPVNAEKLRRAQEEIINECTNH